MNHDQFRDGLKRLQSYIQQLDFQSTFFEEGPEIPMDSLVIPLHVGEDLSIDISCNFIDIQDKGPLLQFYGQMILNELLEDASTTVTKERILDFVNRLNLILPIGQLFYLSDEKEENGQKILGIRYTIPTELDKESELKKCVKILVLLMQVYELLCSCLLLFIDGDSMDGILETIGNLLNPGE